LNYPPGHRVEILCPLRGTRELLRIIKNINMNHVVFNKGKKPEKPAFFPVVVLLVIVLLIPASLCADNTSPENITLLLQPDLRHEPIQPLAPPKGLNPYKVSLGERLFHDRRLGRDNDMACSSCHNVRDNGADHHALAPGRDGTTLDVNTLTVFNSSLNHRQFWDGRVRSLEEQVDAVVVDAKEFATTWPMIIGKLKQDKDYIRSFAELYPDGITANNIRNAIAVFERSLVTVNSPFDRFLLGNTNAISMEAKTGYRLFKTYGCVACHQGSNVGGNLFMKLGVFKDYFAARINPAHADLGRFNVTGRERDRHVFRVPGLRLAALTPPYFHDGRVATLADAVRIMAEHQLGRTIPGQDILYIVAFLQSLPGEYRRYTP